MIAPFNCPDIVEPGYEEWVEDDLDSLYAAPATGTDWRSLDPSAFAEAIHGAPAEEQAVLLQEAFGGDADYGKFVAYFPDGPDGWWDRSDSTTSATESVLWMAFRGFGTLILKDDGGHTTRHYIGRQPGYLARCEVASDLHCAGAVPSYRTVLTRCEVTSG